MLPYEIILGQDLVMPSPYLISVQHSEVWTPLDVDLNQLPHPEAEYGAGLCRTLTALPSLVLNQVVAQGSGWGLWSPLPALMCVASLAIEISPEFATCHVQLWGLGVSTLAYSPLRKCQISYYRPK